jgi:hypothetical protein
MGYVARDVGGFESNPQLPTAIAIQEAGGAARYVRLFLNVADHDLRSLRGVRHSNGPPESRACAGDNCYVVLQSAHDSTA